MDEGKGMQRRDFIPRRPHSTHVSTQIDNVLLAQSLPIKNPYIYPSQEGTLSSLNKQIPSSLTFTSLFISFWCLDNPRKKGFCLVAKAMAKFVAVFLLALIAISMLQTLVRKTLPFFDLYDPEAEMGLFLF